MNKVFFEKFYSLFIAAIPILGLYSFQGLPFTLMDFFLAVIFCLFLFRYHKIRIERSLIPLILLLIVNIFLMSFFYDSDSYGALLGKSLRLLFDFIVLFIVNRNIFNKHYVIKYVLGIGFISALFLWIEVFLAHVMGIYLPGVIEVPGFDVRSGLVDFVNSSALVGYRPRAFFGEPSFCAIYFLICLMFLQIGENIKHVTIKTILFISSVIFTQSLLGVCGLLFLGLMKFGYYLKRVGSTRAVKKNLILEFYFLFMFFILGSTYILNSFIGEYFLGRIFKSGGFFSDGRFNGVSYLINESSDWFYIMFGHGLVERDNFLNGYFIWYHAFGIIGILILLCVFLYIFNKSDSWGKQILLLYLFLTTAASMFSGVFVVFFFAILLSYRKKNQVAM